MQKIIIMLYVFVFFFHFALKKLHDVSAYTLFLWLLLVKWNFFKCSLEENEWPRKVVCAILNRMHRSVAVDRKAILLRGLLLFRVGKVIILSIKMEECRFSADNYKLCDETQKALEVLGSI